MLDGGSCLFPRRERDDSAFPQPDVRIALVAVVGAAYRCCSRIASGYTRLLRCVLLYQMLLYRVLLYRTLSYRVNCARRCCAVSCCSV